MSDQGGGDDTQSPLSENLEYAPDDYASSRSASRLLRPRRSLARPVLVPIAFGAVALLVAIGISKLGPDNLLKLSPQDETAPPPKRPDRFFEQPVEPPEPFKSLVLDAAQSYLAAGRLPVVTSGPLVKPSPATR
jgi:hypothetical protein